MNEVLEVPIWLPRANGILRAHSSVLLALADRYSPVVSGTSERASMSMGESELEYQEFDWVSTGEYSVPLFSPKRGVDDNDGVRSSFIEG